MNVLCGSLRPSYRTLSRVSTVAIRCYQTQHHGSVPQDFFFHPSPQRQQEKSPQGPQRDGRERISDMEWDIRVGRATFLLESTLPEFFTTGLVTSSNISTGEFQKTPASDDTESAVIYSKGITLTYTPPTPLPSPFPRTLKVEGLSLYQASATFMRTSLMTLYSDCTVALAGKAILAPSKRERQVKISMIVAGRSRLTGSPAEWDVRCTYSFSPVTGLIYLHEVESIDPAPHIHVYDALRLSLSRLLGIGEAPQQLGEGSKVPVAAHDRTRTTPTQ